jgi:hypothetical protein
MRVFPFSLIAVVVGLVGCDAKGVEDSKEPPPLTTDDTGDCNLHAPVITDVEVTNGGLQTFDSGTFPTIGLAMSVDDDDGDLDILGMFIWFDDVVDGAVDQSAEPSFDAPAYLFENAEPCGKFSAMLTLKPAVTSGTLQYSTRYEFAVVAEDHHAVRSTPYIVDGVTPNMDGSDGSAP